MPSPPAMNGSPNARRCSPPPTSWPLTSAGITTRKAPRSPSPTRACLRWWPMWSSSAPSRTPAAPGAGRGPTSTCTPTWWGASAPCANTGGNTTLPRWWCRSGRPTWSMPGSWQAWPPMCWRPRACTARPPTTATCSWPSWASAALRWGAGQPASSASAGNRTLKRAPGGFWPGWASSSSTSAWCLAAISITMGRPRPEPSASLPSAR